MQENLKVITSFDQVSIVKEKEERLKEITIEFFAEKFRTEEFRRHFVHVNGKWLKENLKLILSPLTQKL